MRNRLINGIGFYIGQIGKKTSFDRLKFSIQTHWKISKIDKNQIKLQGSLNQLKSTENQQKKNFLK